MVETASVSWWHEAYRIVQTNLRLTDATLDPEELTREARRFGATAVTFNVGGIYAFYPTGLKLQAPNPYLTGDLTGEMLKALHREGLRMVGRYDFSKATRIAYEAHPDWFVHSFQGTPLQYNGTYQACVNGGWYSDYAQRILEESLARYDLDAVFINMLGYRSDDYSGNYHGICWCQNCQGQFKSMFGRELPQSEDFSNPAYRDYLEFQERTSAARSQQIYDTVKRVRPTAGVMLGRATADFMRLELQRVVRRPQPEWPHQAGEKARWGAAFGRGEKPYSCASVNFLDFPWRYSSETSHHHLLRFAQAIASGAQLDYYLLGLFDQENAEPLDAVHDFFKWHEAHGRHYAGMRSQARVGLYHSRAVEIFGGATATHAELATCFRGAYRALLESRIPFDFISDERMEDADVAEQLARYDVIVLPNVNCLSAAESAVLDAFVERGGVLIATGETGLYDERGEQRDFFALESFPAHRVKFSAGQLQTYVRAAKDELSFPKTRLLHLDGWYFYCEAKENVSRSLTLMPQQRPGPPELCFPEVAVTDSHHPGILTNQHGRGRVLYLPWLPEWLYYRDGLPEHRELLAQLVLENTELPIKVEGVGPVEATIHRQHKSRSEYLIHLVNYSGQRNNVFAEPVPLRGFRIGLKGGCGPAKSLIDGKAIEVGPLDDSGYAWMDVPAIGVFQAILAREPSE
jgi:Hypothetical glycosyl hydrolase 6/Beta-galactosidase trimerisation domain